MPRSGLVFLTVALTLVSGGCGGENSESDATGPTTGAPGTSPDGTTPSPTMSDVPAQTVIDPDTLVTPRRSRVYAEIVDQLDESPDYWIEFFAETAGGEEVCVTYYCGDKVIIAGTYHLTVRDKSRSCNIRLEGPGVDLTTSGARTETIPLTLRPGIYDYTGSCWAGGEGRITVVPPR